MLVLQNERMKKSREFNLARMSSKMMNSLGVYPGDVVDIDGQSYFVGMLLPGEDSQFKETSVFVADTGQMKSLGLSEPPRIISDVTVGCDPELFLVNPLTNRLIDASAVLPFTGQVGSDGNLAELRPGPSESPAKVMRNLRELIKTLSEKAASAKLFSSSFAFGASAGFHVHIGIPAELSLYGHEKVGEFFKNMARLLDFTVGLPALLRDPDNVRRGGHHGYGMPGDFRVTPVTFEYRVAGGYNLAHPILARSLLEGVHFVCSDVIARASTYTARWTHLERFNTYEHFKEAYGLPEYKYLSEAMRKATNGAILELLPESKICLSKLMNWESKKKKLLWLFDGYPQETISDIRQVWL